MNSIRVLARRIVITVTAAALGFVAPQTAGIVKADNSIPVTRSEIKNMNLPTDGSGFKCVEASHMEDLSSKLRVARNRSNVSPDQDSVFIRGASDRIYNTLSRNQKYLYDDLDLGAQDVTANAEDLELWHFDIGDFYVYHYYEFVDSGVTQAEAIKAYLAYVYDHPAYYWISTTVLYNDEYIYLISEPEYASYKERRRINKLVEDGIKEYAALAENNANSTLEKIAVIHDRICSDVEYAYDEDGYSEKAHWAHCVQGVFDSQKKVVCQGYAAAFSLAMNYLSIGNYNIAGTLPGGIRHSWNAVYDGTNWLYMDLTGDDCQYNGYFNFTYDYFGMPRSQFLQNHTKFTDVADPLSGGEVVWLYNLDDSGFSDSFDNTYYNRGGFYYDGNNANTFTVNLLTKIGSHFRNNVICSRDVIFTVDDDGTDLPQGLIDMYYALEGTNFRYYSLTMGSKKLMFCYFRVNTDFVNDGVALETSGTEFTYNGEALKPEITLKFRGKTLVKDRDYSLSDVSSKTPGNYEITATGAGSYTGTLKATYRINEAELPTATLSQTEFAYNGTTRRPEVSVSFNGTKLTEGQDYTATYSDPSSKNVGTYSVTVTGKGNFKGSQELSYTISPEQALTATLSQTGFTYNGTSQRPEVTVSYNGTTLTEGQDYTATYSDPSSKNAGAYGVSVTGKGNYQGSQELSYTIDPVSIDTLVLKDSNLVYNKKSQVPVILTFGEGGGELPTSDYTVSYANSDSKKIGSYKMTVTGTGNVTGSRTFTYTIGNANTLKVNPKTIQVNQTSILKAKNTYSAAKPLNIKNGGQGTKHYEKIEGNDGITVDPNSGKLYLSKDLAGGEYPLTIKVTAAGNKSYLPGEVVVNTTLVVKPHVLKANTLKVTAKQKNVSYKTLCNKNVTVSRPLNMKKSGQGNKSYEKVSGDENLTVDPKTGKVTVKSGLAVGVYPLTIRVTAEGNFNYRPGEQVVETSIIVK